MQNEIDKTSHIITKYQNLANNFGLEVEAMVDEMTEVVDSKTEIVHSTGIDVVTKNHLREDFHLFRKILIDSIQEARDILRVFALEIKTEGVEVKPGILTGYSEIMNAVNQNAKLLINIYKDIVKIEVDMHKANSILPEEEDKKGNVYIQNNIIASTADIMSKYTKGIK